MPAGLGEETINIHAPASLLPSVVQDNSQSNHFIVAWVRGVSCGLKPADGQIYRDRAASRLAARTSLAITGGPRSNMTKALQMLGRARSARSSHMRSSLRPNVRCRSFKTERAECLTFPRWRRAESSLQYSASQRNPQCEEGCA